MLDKDFIKTKVKLIQRDLSRLEDLKGLTLQQVAKDFYKWSTLKLVLVEIIGRAVDINSHIIAEKENLREKVPSTLRETFLALGEIGILPPDFAEEISESASFRNKVIHEYNDLKKDTVYESIDEALEQYTKYCQHILNYLKQVK